MITDKKEGASVSKGAKHTSPYRLLTLIRRE